MADTRIIRLDPVSRGTIGRFTLKVGVAMLVAMLVHGDFAGTVTRLLIFYAIFAVVTALLVRQRAAAPDCLNFWDEASWLLFAAMAMDMLG